MTGKPDPKEPAVCEEVNGNEMQGHEPKDMDTELDLLSDRARASGAERIENVARLLSPANLKECLGRLKRGRAAGTDGVTLEEYEGVAETALPELVERMKRMSYKPQPVRRVRIPKANGKTRPLGIPAVEDKVVQCGMARILESVCEAERALAALRERLAKFGLELAEEKTRRIEFGRHAERNAKAKGRKPESFDFLGFTHYIGKTRGGAFKAGMKTSRKKLNAKLKEMTRWIKAVRNLLPLKHLWKTLKAKLSGHFQYFGVSGNYRGISKYYSRVLSITLKWLNRRSRKKSFSWKTYGKYLERHPLPKPKIHHDFYGLKCLFVNVTEEPYVGNPQVRFCEGR